jgi:hypothetical protein
MPSEFHRVRTVRAYVVITGVIFGLIVAVHIWRAVIENFAPLTQPPFVVLTLLALGLCGWSAYLLRRSS